MVLTKRMPSSGSGGLITTAALLIVLAAVVAGLLVAMARAVELQALNQAEARATLPPLSEHALLHTEAPQVWNWLNAHDTRFCRYDCGDRTRYGCQMGNGQWIFAVADAADTVTAFFCDQEYAVAHTRDDDHCHPYMNGAHP